MVQVGEHAAIFWIVDEWPLLRLLVAKRAIVFLHEDSDGEATDLYKIVFAARRDIQDSVETLGQKMTQFHIPPLEEADLDRFPVFCT